MTVENAVAIAGGFTPRAMRKIVKLNRTIEGEPAQGRVPLTHPVRPGDTVVVAERWL
jgi:polysaccharide export outer membrane protein